MPPPCLTLRHRRRLGRRDDQRLNAGRLALDHEDPDRPLLPVAEGVVDEGKLAADVAEELEAHAAPRRNGEGLDPADRRPRRGAEVDGVELLADDVEVARMLRPDAPHPE